MAKLPEIFSDMIPRNAGEEEREKRDNVVVRMRSISNYIMGILLIAVGCFFFFPMQSSEKFLSHYEPSMIKLFAVICWIYGIFRLYRGYKKNYFRES